MSQFQAEYDARLAELRANPPTGWAILNSMAFNDSGEHPFEWQDVECAFVADVLYKYGCRKILDVGSYRKFLLGLSASPNYDITSVEIRNVRNPVFEVKQIISDIRDLTFNGEFDAVISLCTIEHIGLGRYGDEFDLNGDVKAVEVMKGALAMGGLFIFSLPITNHLPTIVFNAHRIYNYSVVKEFCVGLEPIREFVWGITLGREITQEEVTSTPSFFEVYCGVWRKAWSS